MLELLCVTGPRKKNTEAMLSWQGAQSIIPKMGTLLGLWAQQKLLSHVEFKCTETQPHDQYVALEFIVISLT